MAVSDFDPELDSDSSHSTSDHSEKADHSEEAPEKVEEEVKKVTFRKNVKLTKPPKSRRKSLNQLVQTTNKNLGKLDVAKPSSPKKAKVSSSKGDALKHNLELPSSPQKVKVSSKHHLESPSSPRKVKVSFSKGDDRKSKTPFGGEAAQGLTSAERKMANLERFEATMRSAQVQNVSNFMKDDLISKRKAHNLISTEKALHHFHDLDMTIPEFAGLNRPLNTVYEEGGRPFLPRRRSTMSMYSNPQAIQVLADIKDKKIERKKEKLRKELDSILYRVKMSLFDAGIEFDDEEVKEKEKHKEKQQRQKLIESAFDTHSEREKMQERNYLWQKLEDFEVKALTREAYLTELMMWFEDNMDICGTDCLSPEEQHQMWREATEMHRIITNCMNNFELLGDRILYHGKALLEETSEIIKEKNEMLSRKTKKERIVVYDDKMLTADPVKWESAVNNIIIIFEDTFKMIKNINYRNALQMGKRQFDFLMTAAEKRHKELEDKKKQCHELHGKLHAAKMANDKLGRELEDQKRKLLKTTSELNETKQTLEKMKGRNKDLKNQVAELNARIKFLEEETEKIQNRTPTPPPTPPPPPEPETIIVKRVDSATELQLRELEAELEEAKGQIEDLLVRTVDLETQIRTEQDFNEELQAKIVELDSVEVSAPLPQLPVITEVPPPLQPESTTQEKDSSYYKTLMTGMKNEFTVEIEKLKSHVQKEKSRNEASMRRLESQQKEQLANIQRDTIRMLRAMMHFRDQMILVLERDNLPDQAQALKDLGSLLKDKLSPDPREVLAQVVGSVVEYLHKMEKVLNNGFLGMKIMMKYQVEKQVEAELEFRRLKEKKRQENTKVSKDIKKRKSVLRDASDDVKKLARKLKKTKNKLKKYQVNLEDGGDRRYQDLMIRYKQVWHQYKNMQNEMEMLQTDLNKTMQLKMDEKESLLLECLKIDLKEKLPVTEDQFEVPVADQKQNLKHLSKAFEKKKISKNLYTTASALIEKTLEIPGRRLQNLFEQYINFRNAQKTKERVEHVLKDEDLAKDVQSDMKLYLEQMDRKIDQSVTKWKTNLRELEAEKNMLNKKMYSVFNEVLVETGLLLIHPLLKDTDKSRTMIKAILVNQEKMKMLMKKKEWERESVYWQRYGLNLMHRGMGHSLRLTQRYLRHGLNMKKQDWGYGLSMKQHGLGHSLSMLMRMPVDGIKGNQCAFQQTKDRFWFPNQIPPAEPEPRVTEPHMLSYEVNKHRLMSYRHIRDKLKEYPVFKAESFNIAEKDGIQFLREIPFFHLKRHPFIFPRLS